VHSGEELDLLVFYKGKKYGFEFKVSSTPSVTKSMEKSLEVLNLEHLYIVCPTQYFYPIHEKMSVAAPWDIEKMGFV
jgi:predicted AAA+ superfamily ATPase